MKAKLSESNINDIYTKVFVPTSREYLFMPYEQVPEQDNVL